MKNKEILHPASPILSKDFISLMKANIVFEDQIYIIMADLIRYYEFHEGEGFKSNFLKPETIKKNAQQSIEKWNKSLSLLSDDCEIWESFVDKDFFDQYILGSLSSAHYGYCIGIRDTCERCSYEKKFNIPSTVAWKNYQIEHMLKNPDEEFKPDNN